ncbi:hypothetical protein DFH07DRAFT_924082 [Mycena maculata]|uniref:Uncharacterized protein n=1 Tax=Mycena maculata TaxID=230809 RepID=A0AAD7N6V3_9AGAR|nr:hypothetical protein DFH07DRAFT_924082 [Mycena maculata]
MDSLPIDMSHPAVRDYLKLVRLQVLTPLSLLINIATVMVCTLALNPSIRTIAKMYPTSISPRPSVISVYVAAMYLGQIGYCILLVIARKPETKRTLTKGVGLSLVLANWVMALWAVAWIFEWFLAATIFQGLLLILLLYTNITLLTYHAPTTSRPLDMALIHAPLRFFFVLQFALMFPLTLFVQLGLTYTPVFDGAPDYQSHPWPGFGVVLGTNLVSLVVIALRRDVVWCAASTWICVSMWTLPYKPQVVYITVLVFTTLHPLALIASYIHAYFRSRRSVEANGAVALPGNEHPGLNTNRPSTDSQLRGPREVDPEAVWGN